MKKLLFLFIPLVSLSQSFDDLMRVDSKEQFVRAMVENGYERISNNNSQLVYALNPSYDEKREARSSAFANYLETDSGSAVLFEFVVNELYESQYDKIFDVAKVKCEYDSLVANIYDESDEMVRYKCDWDEDKRITGRYVAFSKKDGTGYIMYIFANPQI